MQKFRKAPQFLLCQYQPKNQPFLPFPLFSFGMCDTPVFCSFTTISCMSRPKDFQNHKAVLALENCISNVLAFIKWAFFVNKLHTSRAHHFLLQLNYKLDEVGLVGSPLPQVLFPLFFCLDKIMQQF